MKKTYMMTASLLLQSLICASSVQAVFECPIPKPEDVSVGRPMIMFNSNYKNYTLTWNAERFDVIDWPDNEEHPTKVKRDTPTLDNGACKYSFSDTQGKTFTIWMNIHRIGGLYPNVSVNDVQNLYNALRNHSSATIAKDGYTWNASISEYSNISKEIVKIDGGTSSNVEAAREENNKVRLIYELLYEFEGGPKFQFMRFETIIDINDL